MASRSGPVRPGAAGTAGDAADRPIDITPASAGWTHLAFAIVDLAAGGRHHGSSPDRETAIVPLAGTGRVLVEGLEVAVSRSSVFEEMATVTYVPPGVEFVVESDTGLQVAIGSAPATGRLPVRVIEPAEMRSEIRGGGTAYRQVIHTLAPPLPAERLIVYEVYVPRGTWAGWPPHRHDGAEGSPYLEEVYHFRLDRPEGYVLHRNFADGVDGDDFDEVVTAHDGDVVLVPKGYHTSVASPGSNMYFLNYLAGDLELDERRTPPCFHADHVWIEADWTAGAWELPVVRTT